MSFSSVLLPQNLPHDQKFKNPLGYVCILSQLKGAISNILLFIIFSDAITE